MDERGGPLQVCPDVFRLRVRESRLALDGTMVYQVESKCGAIICRGGEYRGPELGEMVSAIAGGTQFACARSSTVTS